jgi:hypothetical protein
MMSRKPFAVHVTPGSGEDEDYGLITVICDDGAFFTYNWRDGEWARHHSIPGTSAASEDEDLKRQNAEKAYDDLMQIIRPASNEKSPERG